MKHFSCPTIKDVKITCRKTSFQLGIAMTLISGILCAVFLPPIVWNALSADTITPTISIMIVFMILSTNAGAAILAIPWNILFVAVSGLLYMITILLTYACTFPDFYPSTTKAIAMFVFFDACLFFVHLCRTRWPRFDVPGKLAQVMGAFFTVSTYWGHSLSGTGLAFGHFVLFYVVGTGVMILVLACMPSLYPTRLAVGKLKNLYSLSANLLRRVVNRDDSAVDVAIQVGQLIGVVDNLVQQSQWQFDWKEPHRLDKGIAEANFHLTMIYALSMTVLVKWKRFGDEACQELVNLVESMANVLDGISGRVNGEVIKMLVRDVNDKVDTLIKNAPLDLGNREIHRMFLLISKQILYIVQCMYKRLDIDVRLLGVGLDLIHFTVAPFNVVKRERVKPSWWLSCLEAIQLRPWQIWLSLQLVISVMAAWPMVVIESVYLAFQQHTPWIIFTVVILADTVSSGSLIDSSIKRLVGTAITAVVGILTIGIAVGINGGTYENGVGKLVTIGILASIVIGIFTWLKFDAPPGKTWFAAGISFIILVFLPVEDDITAPFAAFGWRLLCVLIGLSINVIFGFILPVTARNQMRDRSCRMLTHAIHVADGIGQGWKLEKLNQEAKVMRNSVNHYRALKGIVQWEETRVVRKFFELRGARLSKPGGFQGILQALELIEWWLTSSLLILGYHQKIGKDTDQYEWFHREYAQVLKDLRMSLLEERLVVNLEESIVDLLLVLRVMNGKSEIMVRHCISGLHVLMMIFETACMFIDEFVESMKRSRDMIKDCLEGLKREDGCDVDLDLS